MKIEVEPLDNEKLDKLWKERNDLMYTHVQRYIAFITKAQDDALRKVIIEHAQERSKELGEDIEVLFADEEKVNRIIDLGIKEYLKEEEHKRWRGRDWSNT